MLVLQPGPLLTQPNPPLGVNLVHHNGNYIVLAQPFQQNI